MKIALITPEYPPFTIGGGGQVYQNLALEYAKTHQVVVIYSLYQSSITSKIRVFKQGKVKFYEIPLLPTPKFLPFLKIRMPLNPFLIDQIKTILATEQPDVAHLHGYGFPFIDLMAWLLKRQQIPYLLTVHGWPIKQNLSNSVIKKSFNFYLDRISSQSLKNAQKLSTVSQFLKDQLPKFLQLKTEVIYNGFISPTKAKQKIDLHQLYQLPKDKKIILSLGRLAQIKGFQEVILKLKRISNYVYLIAGEDEGYKSELERLISLHHLQGRVKFIGYLRETEKNQHLQAADVIAIPSLIEGFGLVALEAAFYHKPIILGQAPALWEVLDSYQPKVSLNDPQLWPKLSRLIQSRSKKSSKLLLDRYSYPKITKHYLKLLEGIARS